MFNQVRGKKRIRRLPEEYPDHQKLLVLGTYHKPDPNTNLLYLKDIERVRDRNLKRLKPQTKGPLYLASIHGKAEVVLEVMRAYDRQGVQQEWEEKGRLKLIPPQNFYLMRAYYVLRQHGWEEWKLSDKLEIVQDMSKMKEKWSRWVNWKTVEDFHGKAHSFVDRSTPPHTVNTNYRKFLEKMTNTSGSAIARAWEVSSKSETSTNRISERLKPTVEEDIDPKNVQEEDTPPEIPVQKEEIPEIWKPNQKDQILRQSTFSHPSQQTLAQATKQLRSAWSPTTFHELNLIKGLPDAIEKVTLGHLTRAIGPTDIQSLAIPIITKLDTIGFDKPDQYRSFLIAAETGSGKTLAYLIPLINRLKREEEWALKNPTHPNSIFHTHRAASPRALIIVPTSELAQQIYEILKRLSHEIKFTACAILPKFDDSIVRKSILSKYIDILISTPHRLNEFLQSKELRSRMVRYVIIDEADTIFDRSFSESTSSILDMVKQQLTHLLLCTATIPIALERQLSSTYPGMQRIVAPKIHMAPRRIDFTLVLESDKRQALLDTLRTIQSNATEPDVDVKRAIIFCNVRESVREIYEYLKSSEDISKTKGEEGIFELIPFTRENFDRHTALERFHEKQTNLSESKKLRILITTDMGSRGLDTITAKTVVLYDVPYSSIDLLHRLGRTARAGTRGKAFMIVSKAEYRGRTKEWVNEIRDRLIRGEALV